MKEGSRKSVTREKESRKGLTMTKQSRKGKIESRMGSAWRIQHLNLNQGNSHFSSMKTTSNFHLGFNQSYKQQRQIDIEPGGKCQFLASLWLLLKGRFTCLGNFSQKKSIFRFRIRERTVPFYRHQMFFFSACCESKSISNIKLNCSI